MLLIGADCGHCGTMKSQMQQNMAIGTNNYPKSIDVTMNILNTFAKTNRSGISKKTFQNCEDNTEVAFAQKDLSDVTCYHCREKGHFARICPSKKSTNEAHIHNQIMEDINDEDKKELGCIYHQNLMGLTWKTCLLINSESSVDIFNNAKYLNQSHKVKTILKLQCNSRCISMNQKGWFGDIEIWYYPKGIANILSFKTLKQCHHVTYDSQDKDGVFKVHTKSGSMEFIPPKWIALFEPTRP